ncbi:MAG: DEAD/DEAH box helicase family protein [Gemmatimonadetes bacterium]|nr:DEAD/DEAH box helicase family protein [Gemmatimonadota bacterium]MCY3944369.1 DEAD/DEAH box helicase family protein [Gemmatimonadota bacterium]
MTDRAGSLVDEVALDMVASNLDLRAPNKRAVKTIALRVGEHEASGSDGVFEGVIDAAVGMGKTYIMAAAMDYFAASEGTRNFAIITPGSTILQKTKGNFTRNHPKSLLPGLTAHPVVITSENFNTPAMRAVMDDPAAVKLYVFTVQSLLKPTTKVGRRTHKFQEGLGRGFYEQLRGLGDLVVFADEHHVYDAPKFSDAVRDLSPRALIGLTGTPTKKMEPRIIYRFPLAAAIAERYVKTPVIVGRRDDLDDAQTKLRDGVQLLDLKQQAVDEFAEREAVDSVNAVMLVVAQSIQEAQAYAALLKSQSFAGGKYAGRVLEIHSKSPDKDLAELEAVENRDSHVRIIVAVDKLKEGWDVKNVYVIASMRASISKILTEQTLGRGLRLPFGRYTGVEFLDTLEVLAHESYDKLLKARKVFQETFIDHRTHAVVSTDRKGNEVVRSETAEVGLRDGMAAEGTAAVGFRGGGVETATETPAGATVATLEGRTAKGASSVRGLRAELRVRDDVAPILVPQLRMTTIRSRFSLADLTDMRPFRLLGEKIAADPAQELRRTVFSARRVVGPDGLPQVHVVRREAADAIEASADLFPMDRLRSELARLVLSADVVPGRTEERRHLGRILDAFVEGLGERAQESLSHYLDRAAARLIQLIGREQQENAPPPSYEHELDIVTLKAVRIGRPKTSDDRRGPFRRGVGYTGWAKSLYSEVWFDSTPERAVALILDEDDSVSHWVRLHRNDLPILWHNAGRDYNPDLIAVENDGTHLLIEVKSDREIDSIDVTAKAKAARRWTNYVNGSDRAPARWRYLLLSETDIDQCKESWAALKGLSRE